MKIRRNRGDINALIIVYLWFATWPSRECSKGVLSTFGIVLELFLFLKKHFSF